MIQCLDPMMQHYLYLARHVQRTMRYQECNSVPCASSACAPDTWAISSAQGSPKFANDCSRKEDSHLFQGQKYRQFPIKEALMNMIFSKRDFQQCLCLCSHPGLSLKKTQGLKFMSFWIMLFPESACFSHLVISILLSMLGKISYYSFLCFLDNVVHTFQLQIFALLFNLSI